MPRGPASAERPRWRGPYDPPAKWHPATSTSIRSGSGQVARLARPRGALALAIAKPASRAIQKGSPLPSEPPNLFCPLSTDCYTSARPNFLTNSESPVDRSLAHNFTRKPSSKALGYNPAIDYALH